MEFFHERLQRQQALLAQHSAHTSCSFDPPSECSTVLMASLRMHDVNKYITLLISNINCQDSGSLSSRTRHASSWSVTSGDDPSITSPINPAPAGPIGGDSGLLPKTYSFDATNYNTGVGSFARQESTDSFTFTNKDGVVTPRYNAAKLRSGFKWQRQLVFRSKLTMHTAFDRKDNVQPAAITALAPSR
jgi:hypothetical protein